MSEFITQSWPIWGWLLSGLIGAEMFLWILGIMDRDLERGTSGHSPEKLKQVLEAKEKSSSSPASWQASSQGIGLLSLW